MLTQKEIASSMWFQKIDGIGDRSLFKLQSYFGCMEEAYKAEETQLKNVLNERQVANVIAEKKKITPLDYMEFMIQNGIRYVPHAENLFPAKLLHIPSPPFGIFVKGKLPSEIRPAVAMIGTRVCSDYGKEVAIQFAQQLATFGVQIISGMARGIDAISQSNCLKAGGDTYAVLGCGVDVCYPSEYKQLYTEISKRGGVISTYAPGSEPRPGCFPARNRIISALSDVVLVIEAGEKSGTLITVDMALEQGKEVAVIPGRITDRLSRGCLSLLKQGATAVTDVEEVLELLRGSFLLQPQTDKNDFEEYNFNEKRIEFHRDVRLSEEMASVFKLLTKEPSDAEKLYESWRENGAEETFSSFMEILMDLELMDLCKSNKNRFSIQ